MKLKSVGTQSKKQIMSLLLLSVPFLLTACASGMTRTEGFQIEEHFVSDVRRLCSRTFPDSTSGTIEGLWNNKRAIVRQSRDCTEAATVLADKVENRNKVIGN